MVRARHDTMFDFKHHTFLGDLREENGYDPAVDVAID